MKTFREEIVELKLTLDNRCEEHEREGNGRVLDGSFEFARRQWALRDAVRMIASELQSALDRTKEQP